MEGRREGGREGEYEERESRLHPYPSGRERGERKRGERGERGERRERDIYVAISTKGGNRAVNFLMVSAKTEKN